VVEETAKLSDPDLLMTVLEVREAIEEAETQEEVEVIKRENGGRIERVEERLRRAFEDGKGEDARDGTVELRYWEGLKRACDDWEPGKRVELVHE
jgi:molecular chaperone HscB